MIGVNSAAGEPLLQHDPNNPSIGPRFAEDVAVVNADAVSVRSVPSGSDTASAKASGAHSIDAFPAQPLDHDHHSRR